MSRGVPMPLRVRTFNRTRPMGRDGILAQFRGCNVPRGMKAERKSKWQRSRRET